MKRFSGFAAAWMLATALAGVTVALLGASAWMRVSAVGLTLAACLLGGSMVFGRRPLRPASLPATALLVMALFGWHLAQLTPPYPLRSLHVATLLSLGAILLAALLRLIRVGDETRALLLAYSVALSLFLADALLPSPAREEPRWNLRTLHDPPLRFRYRPNSIARTYYPDDPRGYFSNNDSGLSGWQLAVDGDHEARLEYSEREPGWMRVTLATGAEAKSWQVKLVQAPFEIRRGKNYAIRFRARADARRRIGCTVSRNFEPWTAIAPYLELEIQPEWQSFECPFVAFASESNARILFDLAFSDVPVELMNVELRETSTGRDLAPGRQYFVSYRFNSLGFRGPDYAIPAPEGTFRILALGDSFTMGVGVHEQDTFAAQLESGLNAAADRRGESIHYEVINAGVGGYSTEQERLSYELFASAYEPQVVLLTMVYNDDLAFVDEVKLGYVPELAEPPLSSLWARLGRLQQPERAYDYSTSVRELLRLHQSCRERGARLAVAIFRQSSWEPWLQLVDAVTEGVRGTGIPVLDLGPALLAVPEELTVHPADGHPNEIAHRLAAEEIERFLQVEGMIPSTNELQD
jgi:hypothetical protein